MEGPRGRTLQILRLQRGSSFGSPEPANSQPGRSTGRRTRPSGPETPLPALRGYEGAAERYGFPRGKAAAGNQNSPG